MTATRMTTTTGYPIKGEGSRPGRSRTVFQGGRRTYKGWWFVVEGLGGADGALLCGTIGAALREARAHGLTDADPVILAYRGGLSLSLRLTRREDGAYAQAGQP